MKPVIFALSGERLTPDERTFFAQVVPAGFILFGRNCTDPDQLRALTNELRSIAGREELAILIDQEGGRVARLGPPGWPEQPGPAIFDRLYRRAPISGIEAMRVHGLCIASVLRQAGITINCAPLLDLAHPAGHPVIAERALGADPMQVAALGRALLDGMREGGVVGIIKHMPGHGRAELDSHHALPVVAASDAELESDLRPFRSLDWVPAAMTAHVVYRAWDAERPATLSRQVVEDVIRNRIGFGGLLLSDDIGMGALSGRLPDRAQAALAAGCDLVLHCSGDFKEMEEIAAALPDIGADARDRLDRALAWAPAPTASPDYAGLAARRDALLAYA
jgi:beta-N-acetylhexosaminidase